MNLTSRPTSRLADGVGSHALGNLTGDSRAATLRDLSPEVATSSRQRAGTFTEQGLIGIKSGPACVRPSVCLWQITMYCGAQGRCRPTGSKLYHLVHRRALPIHLPQIDGWKQKQTPVRNCKWVKTHADHVYSRQRSVLSVLSAALLYVVCSTIGYHSNSFWASFYSTYLIRISRSEPLVYKRL